MDHTNVLSYIKERLELGLLKYNCAIKINYTNWMDKTIGEIVDAIVYHTCFLMKIFGIKNDKNNYTLKECLKTFSGQNIYLSRLISLLNSIIESSKVNMNMMTLIEQQLEIGLVKYKHGLIIEDDVTQYGCKQNDWREMELEELLDAIIYYACGEMQKLNMSNDAHNLVLLEFIVNEANIKSNKIFIKIIAILDSLLLSLGK